MCRILRRTFDGENNRNVKGVDEGTRIIKILSTTIIPQKKSFSSDHWDDMTAMPRWRITNRLSRILRRYLKLCCPLFSWRLNLSIGEGVVVFSRHAGDYYEAVFIQQKTKIHWALL